MKKKFVVFIVVIVAIASFYRTGFSFGKGRDDLYRELEILAEGLVVVEQKYVEDKSAQDLVYGAMEGMLLSLDSYSQFLTPDDYNNLMVETEGQFGGLGIEITIRNAVLTIVSPIEDTPAWEAGLKSGDIVIKIDGELTKNITLNEAVKTLRGKPGTDIVLTVLREGSRKIEDVTITRAIIKLKDIKKVSILEDNVGYLKIGEFRESTPKDLNKALKKLKDEGMKALVLDVRNNPGGLLISAIEIASRFVENGKVIVSTKSRGDPEEVYKSLPFREKYTEMPIVVLINRGSASGSEILAAALRDNNRAILLGDTTFGKGSVQTIIPLSDGSAMRLTTSKYYTPNGISIHEKGIEPDILVKKIITDNVEEDIFEELGKKKDFDYKKDYQIMRALDLIRGILVLSSSK